MNHMTEDNNRRSRSAGRDIQNSSSSSIDCEGDTQYSDSSLSKYSPIPKRIKTNEQHITTDNIMENHSNSKTDIPKLTYEADPLLDFFLTMAKTVKTFPLNKQLVIKGRLFQMVHNVEIDLMNEQYDNTKPVTDTDDRTTELIDMTTNNDIDIKLEPPNL